MPSVQVEVEGAAELRAALRAVARELPREVRGLHRDAAGRVVEAALPHVPVRTGRLQRSVRALASQRSGRVVAGNARVPYAAPVHWGRSRGNVGSPPGNRRGPNRIAPNPFLWEAAQREQARVEQIYRAGISALVDRVVGSRS